MLLAKLFAALGIVLAACAWLSAAGALPSIDIYLHVTYFVVAPRHLLMFCALTSAFAATVYYVGGRWVHAGWNQTLGILHFSLLMLAAILFFVVARSSSGVTDLRPELAIRRLVIPGFLGISSFLLSWLFFAVNLTWTVVRIVRAR